MTASDTLEPAPSRVARPRRWVPVAVMILVLLAPFAVTIMRERTTGVDDGWADTAVLALRARDVVERPVVAIGPYSRYQWSHPGPAYLVVLAPFAMFDAPAIGAAFLNAACMIAVALLVARRAGLVAGALSGALCIVAIMVRGPAAIASYWNPSVLPALLLALVVLCWTAARGELWAIPVSLGVASLLVQTHIGTTLVVLALLGTAASALVVRWRCLPSERPSRRSAVVGAIASVGVAMVCWIPPVVEQIQNDPGNLGLLAQFFRTARPDQSGQVIIDAVGRAAGAVPARLVGLTAAPTAAALVSMGCVLAALAIGWKRRDGDTVVFALLAGACLVVAPIAAARITDTLYPYLLTWVLGAGATAVIALVIAIARVVQDAESSARPLTITGCLATVFVVVTASTAAARIPAVANSGNERSVAAAAERITGALDDRRSVHLVIATDASWPTAAGIADRLEWNGIAVRVDPVWGTMFGRERIIGEGDTMATVTVGTPADVSGVEGERVMRLIGSDVVVHRANRP